MIRSTAGIAFTLLLLLSPFPAGAGESTSPTASGDASASQRASSLADVLELGPAGRFRLEMTWTSPTAGNGQAHPAPLETSTGGFWFFAAQNLEILVKVIDGCGVNGRWWVFATGLTDVGTTLTVTDPTTGVSRRWTTTAGAPFPPLQATDAFPCN